MRAIFYGYIRYLSVPYIGFALQSHKTINNPSYICFIYSWALLSWISYNTIYIHKHTHDEWFMECVRLMSYHQSCPVRRTRSIKGSARCESRARVPSPYHSLKEVRSCANLKSSILNGFCKDTLLLHARVLDSRRVLCVSIKGYEEIYGRE